MVCIDDQQQHILVLSENGYGKRSDLEDYRITNRGGKGVKTLNVTEKTGDLIAIMDVSDENDLMIITKSGITIRMSIAELRVLGRATQGVKLINLRGKDQIAATTKVDKDDSVEELYDEEGNLIVPEASADVDGTDIAEGTEGEGESNNAAPEEAATEE